VAVVEAALETLQTERQLVAVVRQIIQAVVLELQILVAEAVELEVVQAVLVVQV
jgi:hypothetical protein